MKRLTFDGLFCDIAKCKETPGGTFCENGSCSQRKVWERLKAYEDTGLEPEEVADILERYQGFRSAISDETGQPMVSWGRAGTICKADKEGRLVGLPFALGVTLIDRSDPERPELLKNFRLALAYDHNGIVFHQPLGIFLENVQRGYIAQVSEEAERALEGQK